MREQLQSVVQDVAAATASLDSQIEVAQRYQQQLAVTGTSPPPAPQPPRLSFLFCCCWLVLALSSACLP